MGGGWLIIIREKKWNRER